MTAHALVYALAVKYQVSGLKPLRTRKFKSAIDQCWNTCELAEATRIVYTSTPDEHTDIRDIVLAKIIQHSDKLAEKPDIEATVREIPGLAYALFKRLRVRSKAGHVCLECDTSFVKCCPSCGVARLTCKCTVDVDCARCCRNMRRRESTKAFDMR